MTPINVNTSIDPTKLFNVYDVFCNPFFIEEECVRVVIDGLNVLVTSVGMMTSNLDRVKVLVGLERYSPETAQLLSDIKKSLNHIGPTTMHAYATPPNGVSFPMHTDPDDVLICLVEGEKTFNINGNIFEMEIGKWYFIPWSVEHCSMGSGEHGSVMLSVGMERYLVDKRTIT